MTRSLTLRPSAKVNLTLAVGPARADGFHDVRTVMQSIALHDTLVMSPRRGRFALECRAPGVPKDERNLVWRAARALWQTAGRPGEPADVHVRLEKVIPHEAGLGGGSSDAAAALVGLNIVWRLRLARRELLRVAATLGSDVPFFLVGGTALAAGRGEELYALDDIPRLAVIIVKPSFGVSTADAYRWLDDDRTTARGDRPACRVGALHVGWPTDPLVVRNDLEEPVSARHPEITDIIESACREGALAAGMSGSGSAVFAIYKDAAARRAAGRLRRPDRLVVVTRTLTRREAARRIGL